MAATLLMDDISELFVHFYMLMMQALNMVYMLVSLALTFDPILF